MNIDNSITSGTVVIEDGVKAKEDFAPARKAKVELAFAVPEGQDGTKFLDGVAHVAEAKLAELLGRAAPAAAAAPKAATVVRKGKEAPAPEPEKAPEKTKADLAQEAGLPRDGSIDPAKVRVDHVVPAPAPDPDDLSDILGEAAAPKVISDKELGEAASRQNARLKARDGEKHDPAKIRKLVAEFAGKDIKDVPKLIDVPAAKREAFIAALEAL